MNAKRAQVIDDCWIAVDARTIHDPNAAWTRILRYAARKGEVAQLVKEDSSRKSSFSHIRF